MTLDKLFEENLLRRVNLYDAMQNYCDFKRDRFVYGQEISNQALNDFEKQTMREYNLTGESFMELYSTIERNKNVPIWNLDIMLMKKYCGEEK